jgi:UDP-N-acetylglucosamine 4,6-dehydratase
MSACPGAGLVGMGGLAAGVTLVAPAAGWLTGPHDELAVKLAIGMDLATVLFAVGTLLLPGAATSVAGRLRRAFDGVDVVVHAAALKQVPACEYNPFEAVQTNVHGAENVVAAAIANNVPRVLALSTDKAVNPVNLYGATKLCAEKIFTQGNAYAADSVARFSSVRWGNVVGSRGSVIPVFRKQAELGEITITDEAMTRFWISLDDAVDFVIECLGRMEGGEVFVPKIPSMRITDIADAIAPDAERRYIGIRPGEKLHEVLLTEDESRHAQELEDRYAILPEFPTWRTAPYGHGPELQDGFRYSSDTNSRWLTADELRAMLLALEPVA